MEEHCRVGHHIWAPSCAHVWSPGPLVCSKPRLDQAHLCQRVLRQLSLGSHPGVDLGPREGGAGVPRRQKSEHVALLTLRGAKVTSDDPKGLCLPSNPSDLKTLSPPGAGHWPAPMTCWGTLSSSKTSLRRGEEVSTPRVGVKSTLSLQAQAHPLLHLPLPSRAP